jgi:hypothetical protein
MIGVVRGAIDSCVDKTLRRGNIYGSACDRI